jgi:hypothetical protein
LWRKDARIGFGGSLLASFVAEISVEGILEAGCYSQGEFLMMCLNFEGFFPLFVVHVA